LHVQEPSPHVDWTAGAVELLAEPQPWEARPERPRRAAVSSFGISGTNAHLILQEAPPAPTAQQALEAGASRAGVPVPVVVAAGSAGALRAQAQRLVDHLVARPEQDLIEMAWSLCTSRAALAHRAVILAEDQDQALVGLRRLAAGDPAAEVLTGRASSGDTGGVAFVFPGQGAQWVGMGRGLGEAFPAFAAAIAACEEALAPHVDWSLREVLTGEAGWWTERVDVVQPALWAVMVALAEVWKGLGIRPDVVVGHSQGEIAAACVAGGLSLADGARVVALRSRLVAQRLAGSGGMVAVAAAEDRARELIAPWPGRLGVATVNGPSSVTVSGELEAVGQLLAACEAGGIQASRVGVDYASHSPQVEAIRDELMAAVAGIEPRASEVSFFSTVAGGIVDTAGLDADYWYRNLRQPVRFDAAVRTLLGEGHQLFVEPSPHPMLVAAVRDTVEDSGGEGVAVGTLRRDDGGTVRMVRALADAWVQGAPVDWEPLVAAAPARPALVDLPTYPFEHARFWPTLAAEPAEPEAALLSVQWEPVPVPPRPPAGVGRWAVVGPDPSGLTAALRTAGLAVEEHADLASLAAAEPLPDVVVCPVTETAGGPADVGDVPEVARTVVLEGLGLLQAWLSDERFARSRLVVATRGAMDPGARAAGMVQAPVWGLVRSAQSENPGRFLLVDLDDADDGRCAAALLAAATGSDAEVAIRQGQPSIRRLVPAGPPLADQGFDPAGTVLVTGGLGSLGSIVARHLVERHGVRSLLLTSRRGPEAPGAEALVAALEDRGADVVVAAGDVADRDSLASVLTRTEVLRDRPLRGIVHTAGMIDDGVVSSLTPAQVDRVWRGKVAGAWNLHHLAGELELDLTAFVVFSSTAGQLGAAGQANYAAASAFLDALMDHRRALGLVGVSVAWGLWQQPSGLTDHLDATDLARLRRAGVIPLATPEALDLFDAALHHPPLVVATGLDLAALRQAATTEPVPGVWRRLIGTVGHLPTSDGPSEAADGADEGDALARRLAGATDTERLRILTEVVRAEAATVLGHARPEAIETDRAFKDLGFDSLTAVELRNRLNRRTGLRLATTVVFEHPTVERLSRDLMARLVPPSSLANGDLLAHLAQLEAGLTSDPPDEAVRRELREGLQRALARLRSEDGFRGRPVEEQLASADAEEVFDFIDRELGTAGS